jgi:hypothetical protein
MIGSQAKEGRGSPDDEKGRYGSSLEIKKRKNIKKGWAPPHPIYTT